MPRKNTRRRSPAPRPPDGIFGVYRVVPAWDFWAVWVDGSDPSACLSVGPDAWGWIEAPTLAIDLVSSLLGRALDFEASAAALAAQQALARRGVVYVQREDSLALNAYHRHRPAIPGTPVRAASPPGHQPPWWVAELGCPWPPKRTEIIEAYRARTHVTHPDKPGGNATAFERTRRAYEIAIGWVASQEEQ